MHLAGGSNRNLSNTVYAKRRSDHPGKGTAKGSACRISGNEGRRAAAADGKVSDGP